MARRPPALNLTALPIWPAARANRDKRVTRPISLGLWCCHFPTRHVSSCCICAFVALQCAVLPSGRMRNGPTAWAWGGGERNEPICARDRAYLASACAYGVRLENKQSRPPPKRDALDETTCLSACFFGPPVAWLAPFRRPTASLLPSLDPQPSDRDAHAKRSCPCLQQTIVQCKGAKQQTANRISQQTCARFHSFDDIVTYDVLAQIIPGIRTGMVKARDNAWSEQ